MPPSAKRVLRLVDRLGGELLRGGSTTAVTMDNEEIRAKTIVLIIIVYNIYNCIIVFETFVLQLRTCESYCFFASSDYASRFWQNFGDQQSLIVFENSTAHILEDQKA